MCVCCLLSCIHSLSRLQDEHAISFVVMATPDDMRANAEYIRMADEVRKEAHTHIHTHTYTHTLTHTLKHTHTFAGGGCARRLQQQQLRQRDAHRRDRGALAGASSSTSGCTYTHTLTYTHT